MNELRKRSGHRGFTLVEIMIVVLIIGILLSIAVPNYIKARESSRAKSCIANLRVIDAAKEQWAMENRKVNGDTPGFTDLVGTDKYLKSTPECASGGTYSISGLGTDPSCSRSADGHTLP